MLAYEVAKWEVYSAQELQNILAISENARKVRLEEAWKANVWKHLDEDMRQLTERLDTSIRLVREKILSTHHKNQVHDRLMSLRCEKAEEEVRNTWKLVRARFSQESQESCDWLDSLRYPARSSQVFPRYAQGMENRIQRRAESFQVRCRMRRQEMEARLRNEMDDITERLQVAHSDGLHTCNEFWSSPRLVELTHSDRKWIKLDALDSSSTRRAISRALRRNRHAIYATITIHDATTLNMSRKSSGNPHH